MKRALPMVMKYLAIVGLSCFLAFVISQTGAYAQEATQATTNAVAGADGQVTYVSNMAPGQKYLAVFNGGDHMVFGGHGFGLRRPETARDKEIQAGVMAGTLAFWNATLKHDVIARRWLEQGGYRDAIGSKDTFEQK